MMAREVRYRTQVLPDGDGPFKERLRLQEFATAADLEVALEDQETVLTDARCPGCGTRLKDVGKHSPVPEALKGLLSCANLACAGRDTLYLSHEDGLVPITRAEYRRQLEEARKVGRQRLVAG